MLQLSLSDGEDSHVTSALQDKENMDTLNIAEFLPDASFQLDVDKSDIDDSNKENENNNRLRGKEERKRGEEAEKEDTLPDFRLSDDSDDDIGQKKVQKKNQALSESDDEAPISSSPKKTSRNRKTQNKDKFSDTGSESDIPDLKIADNSDIDIMEKDDETKKKKKKNKNKEKEKKDSSISEYSTGSEDELLKKSAVTNQALSESDDEAPISSSPKKTSGNRKTQNKDKFGDSGSESDIPDLKIADNSDIDNLEQDEGKKKIKKKKIKKKKKKDKDKEKEKKDSSIEYSTGSEDEILKKSARVINELLGQGQKEENKDKMISLANPEETDSDSSVGLPDDMLIVRNKEDRAAVNKKKKVKELIDGEIDVTNWEKKDRGEHDPNFWSEIGQGGTEEGKKKKKSGNKGNKGDKVAKGGKGDKVDPMQEIRSEQQRLIRETDFNLPRHEPKPLLLGDCLAKIPKLSALKPKTEAVLVKDVFRPTLSNKHDTFFMSKDLGNFMNRFKKHLSFTPKTEDGGNKPQKPITKAGHAVIFNHPPNSVLIKKQIQSKLQEQILAKKLEQRRAHEMEVMIDNEDFGKEDEELQKMLDDESEEDMSEEEEDEEEEVEDLVERIKKKKKKKIIAEEDEANEEKEKDIEEEIISEDEVVNRRAEKILQGQDVTSSEEEKDEIKERNYHTDTDSDLLASADEVDVTELPPDSADEENDVMQPSRYSLRRLTRYVRKRRLVRQTKHQQVEEEQGSEEEADVQKDKMEKARKRIERLLAKRKEMKEKQKEVLRKKKELEEKNKEMEEIARLAEVNAREIERLQKEAKPKAPSTTLRSVDRPWLSDDEAVPTCTGRSAQRPHKMTDAELDARAARVLAGEELSSSSEEDIAERNYHTDTDSDLLASADEVDVTELPPDSADEENDVMQPSRYSLRRLTRYCRKKRISRQRKHHNTAAPASDSEKEEKAKKKLKMLLAQREKLRKKWLENKEKRKEGKRALLACSNSGDLFGSVLSNSNNVSGLMANTSRLAGPCEDSQMLYSGNDKTFDIDTAELNLIDESQPVVSRPDFLQPDEDAVFFNTQGLIQTCKPQAGIAALDKNPSDTEDLLDICTGVFSGGFSGIDEGVTLGDFSLRIASQDGDSNLLSTPFISKTPDRSSKIPARTGLSQTPLTHFSKVKLLPDDLINNEESVDGFESDESVPEVKKSKRRLMADFMDEEAEKSGEEHSSDEEELNELDEYDQSAMAKDEDLPSDEEELARQLAGQYQEQMALDEKTALRKLKERFIDAENDGFFRTRKFFTDDANLDLFSPNLGLDDAEDIAISAEEYKVQMEKRVERLKKDQYVSEKKRREVEDTLDDDSQALLDSLHDVTDSASRSSSSVHKPQCGSFLKHKIGTLSRLSSITAASLKTEGLSSKSYVFQSVSPRNSKRPRPIATQSQPSSSQTPKRQKNTATTEKSIFSVIK